MMINQLLKEQLLAEIRDLHNPLVVAQLFEFWQLLKRINSPASSIKSYVGCLPDDSAEEIRQLIQSEFQRIEGDW
jgi:hypothetical protein